ncbi:MAG: preprotein translocase subunit YajC [Actinomycetota bacterium]|nr:preprotein translocase subunit YajC [Actinomycetota bacterium]
MRQTSMLAQLGEGGAGLTSLLWLGALVVLFYFLLIRPQRTRAKRHQELISSLQVGDRIQTVGGIYGVITSLDDQSAVIEVEDGGRLRVARRAVGSKAAQG